MEGGAAAVATSLGSNPYFGAGAGLFGLGLTAALLRRSAVVANVLLRRRFLVSLEVASDDRAYDWLLNWVQWAAGGAARHHSLRTSFRLGESGAVSTQFEMVPSPGDHYFWFRGRIMKVERNRETQMVRAAAGNTVGVPFETVTLSTFGVTNAFLRAIVSEARQKALSQLEAGTVVYRSVGPEWRPFGEPRRKRPLKSVVLADGVKGALVRDVTEFVHSANWYHSRGIPHRRGYLLHGPPGCGKSSFVAALASELGYSICTLSLSERTMTDDRLAHLLNTAPPQSLILLEDIDAAFSVPLTDRVSQSAGGAAGQRPAVVPSVAYDGLTRVTLSGLLNAVDGVSSGDARLLFMTTNYVDRLDDALIRPGRVDVRHRIAECTDRQLAVMFRRFYEPTAAVDEPLAEPVSHMPSPPAEPHHVAVDEQLVDEFVMQTTRGAGGKPVTPAQVQGYLLAYKHEPHSAAKGASRLCTFGHVDHAASAAHS